MQQDKKLQALFEAFASDLQSYISMEVQRQVDLAMMGSDSVTVSKNVSSKINSGVLDQLREEIVDTDSLSEKNPDELKDIELKNTKITPDFLSNSQAVDHGSLMGDSPEEPDSFESSKLDFLPHTKRVSVPPSSVVQGIEAENKYTPGFAGLQQLLSRIRRKST